MKKQKYGASSYSCSCLGSSVIGMMIASAVVWFSVLVFGQAPSETTSNIILITIGWPLLSIVFWATSMMMVFTPAAAYQIIKFFYRDFFQVGKDLMGEK